MSAWQYDRIENAQRAWAQAQRDYPMSEKTPSAEQRPTRPIMEGRGPQLPQPKATASPQGTQS